MILYVSGVHLVVGHVTSWRWNPDGAPGLEVATAGNVLHWFTGAEAAWLGERLCKQLGPILAPFQHERDAQPAALERHPFTPQSATGVTAPGGLCVVCLKPSLAHAPDAPEGT